MGEAAGPPADEFCRDNARIQAYHCEVKLYEQAVVMVAIIGYSRAHPEFEALLTEYLRKLTGVGPALNAAGARVVELIDPNGARKAPSWSMAWLQRIGLQETNVVRLSLFATYWVNKYIAVVKSLDDFRLS